MLKIRIGKWKAQKENERYEWIQQDESRISQ